MTLFQLLELGLERRLCSGCATCLLKLVKRAHERLGRRLVLRNNLEGRHDIHNVTTKVLNH
jgi:hypothetical protein